MARWLSGKEKVALVVKNLPASEGDTRLGFGPWVRKIPWRREWQPTPIFMPEESHGQRSPAGYIPQGWKESDRTEEPWHDNAGDEGDVVWSLGQKDPLEEEAATHSGILTGKSHGQMCLVGSSPWACKESDMT